MTREVNHVAEAPKRVFAFSMAMLFLATVVVGGLLVLWQIFDENQQNNNEETAQQSTEASEEQLQVDDNDPNTLQGSKLDGFDPVNDVNELKKIDQEEGDGEVVKEGATVTAHYTGALAKDGTIFQSSKDFGEPIEFSLDQVIQGWGQGVPGMKVGGKRRLVIPAELAYGEAGSPPSIGPNEPLVFDIEITAVQNP